MNYIKQNFEDGQTLTAEHLNHIEDAIADLASSGKARISEVSLINTAWTSNSAGTLHSQVVTVEGVTPRSQVDLTPSVQQLLIFYEKDLTFVTENNNGTVTVYAIGQKPTNDYVMQVTITEVNE